LNLSLAKAFESCATFLAARLLASCDSLLFDFLMHGWRHSILSESAKIFKISRTTTPIGLNALKTNDIPHSKRPTAHQNNHLVAFTFIVSPPTIETVGNDNTITWLMSAMGRGTMKCEMSVSSVIPAVAQFSS
jgi:hypothetical protein